MNFECSFEEKERIRRQEYYFAYVKREILLMKDRIKDLVTYTKHDESSLDISLWNVQEIEVRARLEDRFQRIFEDLSFCFWNCETSYLVTKGIREKAKIDPPLRLPNVRYYDQTEFPSSLVVYDEEEDYDDDDDDSSISPKKRNREELDSGDTMTSKST